MRAWLHALPFYQNHTYAIFCPYHFGHSFSELSEVLSPRLPSSYGPQIKLNVQLSCCAFFSPKVNARHYGQLIGAEVSEFKDEARM